MECKYLRSDVLDVTGSSLGVNDLLRPSPATFKSDGAHILQDHLQNVVNGKEALNVKKLIYERNRALNKRNPWGFSNAKDEIKNACRLNKLICRFHGTFPINKLKGMFHFTAVGYGYFSFQKVPIEKLNFTHRIDSMSFGKYYPGLTNPLDKTTEIAQVNLENFKVYDSC